MRYALLLLVCSCVPDIGDDDEGGGETDAELPDEMVCARGISSYICSEERPCAIDDDGYYQDCEGAEEGEEPECPCAGLQDGFSNP